ncbi:MAG: TorF family putative porin [Verrucomicrobiota bacterium]
MNKLSKILPAAAVFACASLVTASAQDGDLPIDGNIGVTSNYVFRGVSQTGNDAAVQGGLDFADESGIYIGTWVSNINFAGGTELDVYGGFAGEIGDGIGYDVGVIGYIYPAADEDANFAEVYLGLSWDFLSAGVAYTFISEIDDGYFTDGDAFFYVAGGFDLDDSWSVGLTVGYYLFDFSSDGDYVYGQLDLGKSTDFGDFTFSVSLADESDVAADDPLFFVSWGIGF